MKEAMKRTLLKKFKNSHKGLAKLMVLVMICLSVMTGTGGPTFADAITNGPHLISLNTSTNMLAFSLTADVNGTAYVVVTDETAPSLTGDAIRNGVVGTNGIKAWASYPITAAVALQDELYIESSRFTAGKVYKLQVAIASAAQPSVYLNGWSEPKFVYSHFLSMPQIRETYIDGIVASAKVDSPGILKGLIYPAAENPTTEDLKNSAGTVAASFETAVAADHTAVLTLRAYGQPDILPNTPYKVGFVFTDMYGVYNTFGPQESFTTTGNRLLSVSYENGILGLDNDDTIVLAFQEVVLNSGNSTHYAIAFDSGSSTFVNADLTLSPGDFNVLPADSSPFVRIELTPTGLGKIDTAGEFDNGCFKVTVSGTTIAPRLDSQSIHLEKTAALDQTQIQLNDSVINLLGGLSYLDNNTKGSKADDYLDIALEGTDSGTSVGPMDSLLLDADNNTVGGFVAPDVTFVRGTDYNVSSMSSALKRISFTASGIEKLNTLDHATFRVRLGNPNWGVVTMNPSVHAIFAAVVPNNNRLSGIVVDGRPIAGFDSESFSYMNVPVSYSRYNSTSNLSSFIKATAANGSTAVKVSIDSTDTYRISTFAPTGPGVMHTVVGVTRDDLSIKNITVGGNQIAGFDPLKTDYAMVLPVQTTAIPPVVVTFENGDITPGNVVQTTSGSLPGTATLTWTTTFNARVKTLNVTLTSEGQMPPHIQEAATETPAAEPTAPPVNPNSAQSGITTIETLNQTFTQPPQNSSTTEKTLVLVNGLDKIEGAVEGITNDSKLFGALTQLDETLTRVTTELNQPQIERQSVADGVQRLTETVEMKIETLENPVDALTVLKQYIEALKTLKAKIQQETPVLDQSVEDMISRTAERLGTVKFSADPKTGLVLEAGDVEKPIDKSFRYLGDLKTLNQSYFEDSDTRKLAARIVIELDQPKAEDSMSVTFKPSALKEIQGSRIESFALNIEGSMITIPASEVKTGTNLRIQMDFLKTHAPASTESHPAPNHPSVEITVFENEKIKDAFAKPIELRFEVKDFGYDPKESDALAIYKFNEIGKTWYAVGGIIDPQLGIIHVKRGSLSQYTVMKSKKSFSDSDTSWAKAEIDNLLNKGIVEEGKTFSPKALLTRAEFASWICKAYGLKASASKPMPFKDIKKTDKHYEAIAAVYQLGLINGRSKSLFEPNGSLTNDEMAVIIGKTLVMFDDKQASSKVKSKHLSALKSKDVASWAESDTALLMELGLATTKTLADKNAFVTKESAAAIFMKFYKS